MFLHLFLHVCVYVNITYELVILLSHCQQMYIIKTTSCPLDDQKHMHVYPKTSHPEGQNKSNYCQYAQDLYFSRLNLTLFACL